MPGWLEDEQGWMGSARKTDPEAKPEPAHEVEPAEKMLIVVWVPVICPICRSRDCIVTATKPGIRGFRYQECRTCGEHFRSIEQIPPGPK